jgi:outer membrane protein assembly factor BamB
MACRSGILLLCAVVLGAADTPPEAAAILAAVGHPVGLVHLPRTHDGALALALARAAPSAFVQGQDADLASVRRARASGDEAGLLNLRLTVDLAGLDRLLPVARSCDLVVLTDLTRPELTPALAAEIARVLAPWCGVVVLGGADIAQADLRAWAGSIGALTTDAHLPGLVLVHAAPLTGADDWTHWWHGPDNNALSSDRVYTLPETIQWAGKPYAGSSLNQPIVAGGRSFMLFNGERRSGDGSGYLIDGKVTEKPLLLAQAAGSGALLWTREMPDSMWEQGARGMLVAEAGRLLVAENDTVLALDQATGLELARLDAKCGQIRWMAVADGRLLVLGGPAAPIGQLGQVGALSLKTFRRSGLALAAFALKDLAPTWRLDRQDGDEAFDPCSPAVAGGRVVTTTVAGVVEARDLSDGRLAWTGSAPIAHRAQPEDFEWDGLSRHPVSGYAEAGLYISEGVGLESMTAFDLRDGTVRWRTPTAPRSSSGVLYYDEQIIAAGRRFDPKAGSDLGYINLMRGGCARLVGSPIGIFGTDGFCWDATTKAPAPGWISAKSSCAAGTMIADGLAWKVPTPCVSCTEWRGFLVRGPREGAAPPPGPRLTVVDATAGGAVGETPPGWTTYRGDIRRTAGSAAVVPAAATVAWTVTPLHPRAIPRGGRLMDPEVIVAPPVVAGATVLLADADGSLTALDLADGHRLWRAVAGGRIWSSPTVWRDRVLVGCLDGTVTAFALADGRELWQLRVAPGNARMQVFGQLGSRWPVLCSPLVVGDRGFATAGLLDRVDGVTAAGFDAATGQLLWERSDWRPAGVDGAISGAGQLCWDGSAVVYHGGEAPLVRLDPATGDCLALYPDMEHQRGGLQATAVMLKGQDVGALSDGTLVSGGRRLFTDQNEDGAGRNNTTYLVRGADGLVRLPMPMQQEGTRTILPSWDERQEVSYEFGDKSARVALAPMSGLQEALEGSFALPRVEMRDGPMRPFPPAKPLWMHDMKSVRGLALAANAVIALESVDWEHWNLRAYARDGGKQLWHVRLAVPPTQGGVAIAADGHVVLTLIDGSVMAVFATNQ